MKTRLNTHPSAGRILRGAFWTIGVLTVLRVWCGVSPALPEAAAQIPDAGKQRLALVQQVERTNALLSDIKGLLEQGTLNVRLAGADNPSDRGAGLRANDR